MKPSLIHEPIGFNVDELLAGIIDTPVKKPEELIKCHNTINNDYDPSAEINKSDTQ